MKSIYLSCGCRSNSVNTITGQPSCTTHFDLPGGVHPVAPPNLEGRKARCICGRIETSSIDLAFFEFRGPGSRAGNATCKNCRYHDVAHTPEKRAKNKYICDNFESIESFEFDSFYCGCRGWD